MVGGEALNRDVTGGFYVGHNLPSWFLLAHRHCFIIVLLNFLITVLCNRLLCSLEGTLRTANFVFELLLVCVLHVSYQLT